MCTRLIGAYQMQSVCPVVLNSLVISTQIRIMQHRASILASRCRRGGLCYRPRLYSPNIQCRMMSTTTFQYKAQFKTEPVPSAIGLQSNLPASSVQEPYHSDVGAALRPSQPIPPHARRYENIIAADNAWQISRDVYGNVYFGDNRDSHSPIGMII